MTTTTSEETITIEGDDVARIVSEALLTYNTLGTGNWGAAAELCADRFDDPAIAAEALNRLAAGYDNWVDPLDEATVAAIKAQAAANRDSFAWEPAYGSLKAAVDVYMRIHMGQFDQIALDTGATFGGAGWEAANECLLIRVRHQRPGAWPDHPHASWGIHSRETGRDAQVAYNIWKLLGEGVAGRDVIGNVGADVTVTKH